jgi:hypothetical protein
LDYFDHDYEKLTENFKLRQTANKNVDLTLEHMEEDLDLEDIKDNEKSMKI